MSNAKTLHLQFADGEIEVGTLIDALYEQERTIAILRQHKNDYMEAAEGTRKALEAENARLERLVSHWQGLAVTNRKVADDALAQHQRITAAMAAEVETWRSNALMLEQANVGLAQLNGKLRAELAEVKGREAVGEVQLRTGGGISLLHVDLTQPLPPGTKLYTAPQPAPAQDVAGLVNALKTIYDEDYQVPHDSTDGEIKEGMKRCVFRIRRIVKDALAAHDKQSGGEE